jgi:PhnB protein
MSKPIPKGFGTVTPFLCVTSGAKMIDFLKQAFGGQEIFRMDKPDGSLAHAEVKIGDSMVMIGEVPAGQETHAMIHLYAEGCDL